MELDHYVDRLREQLAVAAEAGGEDARALAQRLAAPLDSAIRLMLLEALAAAAAEITRDLAPGSVELRLRGGTPDFVVTAPPADQPTENEDAYAAEPGPEAGEGAVARINLRLPEQLKSRVEQAADREGLSINAWLIRAVSGAVDRGDTAARRRQSVPRGGQHYTGWGR